MTLKIQSHPSVEPITLAEAKLQCRIESDITADDDLITALIVAARQECEHQLGRALINQVWDLVLDEFPVSEIKLGMPPVSAVNAVTYVDGSGTLQTLDAQLYVLDNESDSEAFVLPADGCVWPSTYDTANAVRVRFTAGYGAAAEDVPELIRAWLKLRIATLYKFREQVVAGISIAELPRSYADGLLDRYRVWGA